MKRNHKRCPNRAALGLFCIFSLFASPSYAAPASIASRTASIDGVQLHYLIAGSGPAVLLLHGYTQTSRMWRPITGHWISEERPKETTDALLKFL